VCVPQTAHNIIKTNDNKKKEEDKKDVSVLHQGPILAAMNAANDCDMFRSATKEVQKNQTTSCTFFDFVMTNPPFYGSPEEAQGPRAGDGRKRTDMTIHESVYQGG
jgi:tRNA1(Val) A37 N6-methylase TrmN6